MINFVKQSVNHKNLCSSFKCVLFIILFLKLEFIFINCYSRNIVFISYCYLDNGTQSKKKKNSECVTQSTTNSARTGELASSSTSNIQPIEVFDEADEVVLDALDRGKSNKETTDNPKNRSQTPAIIMFDSLRTGPKNRVAATLREFLQLEYDHKKPLPTGSSARKIFNLDTIPTIEAAVPQQPNYFDCGLYILQYIESFFEHRSSNINFHSTATFANWCETTSMGSSKRKQIFDIINQHTILKEV